MSYLEADTFLTKFYAEHSEITSHIEALQKLDPSTSNASEQKLSLSSQYEFLSNRTVSLQKFLTENTKFIPKYETRKAQEHLAKLAKISQDKRDEIFPKKKFGFKSKQKMTSLADAITTADELNEHAKATVILDNDEIFYKDSSCTIKDIDDQTVIKLDTEINGKDIAILNINNACIQLYGNPSVLHAKNITNSVIMCGPISGSAFVDNLKNVKLIIACHQLRIHETSDSQFYIHLGSRAIIENCERVRFAPYAWTYPKLEEHFLRSSLNADKSNWECVDDFNWLNQNVDSPNWSFLGEDERMKWVTDASGELKSIKE